MSLCASQELKALGVEIMVAPFEADAELAYLSKTGYVGAVMSEDGDQLVMYKCDVVLSKFEMTAGTVMETGWKAIMAGLQSTCFRDLAKDNLHQRMMEACLLAGGDYLASLNKIGLDTACKLLVKHKTLLKVLHVTVLQSIANMELSLDDVD